MNRIFFLSLIVLVSCKSQTKKEDTLQDSTVVDNKTSQVVQLTESQKAEGWKLLFDGQSLNGWKFYKNMPNNSWEVMDGMLHCKASEEGKENLRSDIMTIDEYENFELSLDWRITTHGNSGIMFRVTEEFDQPYKSGPEYQILDDAGYAAEIKDVNMTASCYDMYAVPSKKLNPPGEWNTTKIVSNGNKIEHWLNGEKVLTYEIGSDDWNKRKAMSKWKDEAGYAMSKKGHIDFQDHDHEAWFKNIMIKPL